MKMYLVYLAYDITFDDADEGECYAGDGLFTLKLFNSEEKAQQYISDYKDIFINASKEVWRFPMYPSRQKLRDTLGIDLSNIESNMKDLRINYKVFEVE